jgi:hypothetical protein
MHTPPGCWLLELLGRLDEDDEDEDAQTGVSVGGSGGVGLMQTGFCPGSHAVEVTISRCRRVPDPIQPVSLGPVDVPHRVDTRLTTQ